MNEKKYPWYFYLIMLTLVIVPFIIVGFYVYQNRNTLIEPYLQDYAMRHMSLEHMTEEAREEYRALLIQQAPGVWDGVPEPLVGRLLQPNNEFTLKMAEMVSNNAGLRSQRAFKPKKAGIYRIVIMGDSIVMGEAGKEEDRQPSGGEPLSAAPISTDGGKLPSRDHREDEALFLCYPVITK